MIVICSLPNHSVQSTDIVFDKLSTTYGFHNGKLTSVERVLEYVSTPIHEAPSYIKAALEDCHNPLEHSFLTYDQLSAIYICTMRHSDYTFHQVLRSNLRLNKNYILSILGCSY